MFRLAIVISSLLSLDSLSLISLVLIASLFSSFLFDILDNAFLEDNSEVQELWANLLVNWQDAEKRADIRMVYIEILKTWILTSFEKS